MNAYFTLLKQVLPYKKLITWFIIFSILTVVFSLVSLVMLVPFLELLFDKTPLVTTQPTFSFTRTYFVDSFYYFLSQEIVQKGKESALIFFCIVVVVVFFLKNLFRYLALYVLSPLRNSLIYDLRSKMYKKMLQLPIPFFVKEQKGDLITKFTTDLTEIEYSIMNTLETSIQSPLTIILFLGTMLAMSPQLTIFVFGMILVMALIVGRIGKNLKRDSAESKEVLGQLTSILDETISGIKIIQAYFVQNWIEKKFDKENKSYYYVYNKLIRRKDLSSPLTEFLAIVVICIVLWFGGKIVLSGGSLSPSNFIAFMVIFSQLIPPAKSFSSAIYEIKKGMASYDRINTILDREVPSYTMLKDPLDSFKSTLNFDNVSFTYDGSETKALDDFSYTFEKGKSYALVGESGAGKSTLFDLILRFLTPQEGDLQIDNKAINNLNLESYRALFGIVPQEPVLFNMTVDENVAFDHIVPEKVNEALAQANALDFANKIKGESIGEKGSKLSGGEKQRLSIARVAYRNPEIVLLDEATSALDSKNENEVQEALNKLLKNKTSIIIAHKYSTIQNVDTILFMEKGKLIASGTHQELYNSIDMFKKMVDMQRFDI